MIEALKAAIAEAAAPYADTRLHVFEIEPASLEGSRLTLTGRVLEQSQLTALTADLRARYPGLELDVNGVRVLRQPAPRVLTVATNLTSLHRRPSWLEEQVSQLMYGWPLEVLEENGRWSFVRQSDGYLGWAYTPYLRAEPAPQPTHLVIAPAGLLRAQPQPDSDLITRVIGGTAIKLLATRGEWAEVEASERGWLPLADLRALDDLPKTPQARRQTMVTDALRLTGTQYLWGGCGVNGIDCSGLAQLVHRWVGITIPRDADMQFFAGRPVPEPFQPGDLLFYGEMENGRMHATHVSVCMGGWHIIHSSRARNGVYQDDVQQVPHLKESFCGACTFIDA